MRPALSFCFVIGADFSSAPDILEIISKPATAIVPT